VLNRLITDCNKEIVKYKAGKRSYPHWADHVLLPLIRDIGCRLELEYKVSGPFGMRTQCYISLMDENNDTIYIISVVPYFQKCGTFIESIHYDTGELKEGCIADLNGFNYITAPLPNEYDEIIRLMKERVEVDIA